MKQNALLDLAPRVSNFPHCEGKLDGKYGGDWELTGSDLILYGTAVSQFGWGLSDEVLQALSWVFLNRRVGDRTLDSLLLPDNAPADWIERALSGSISPQAVCAVSVFASVVSGAVADPVHGATRFHNHLETPSWANKMELRAIIGPYLFYGTCP